MCYDILLFFLLYFPGIHPDSYTTDSYQIK
nr:MAG TPA: hypothetical protein [Caudoviricetes sp.]